MAKMPLLLVNECKMEKLGGREGWVYTLHWQLAAQSFLSQQPRSHRGGGNGGGRSRRYRRGGSFARNTSIGSLMRREDV